MLDSIAKLITLLAGVMAALWAYTKYALERGLLPPVRFYVTGEKVGIVNDRNIIKVKIHIHNTGSATLIARNIRLDLLYITARDKTLTLFEEERKAGRLKFPGSVINDLHLKASNLIPAKVKNNEKKLCAWKIRDKEHRGFLILEEDTFIQAGIDQDYTFVTTVPSDTLCFLTWCSFEYAQNPSGLQKVVSKISKVLGLIQYTLGHAVVPHTTEDVFWIADNAQPGSAPDRQEGPDPTVSLLANS